MFINAILGKLRENKMLAPFLTDKLITQFKRYLITGFSGFGLEYLVFYLLYNYILKTDHTWQYIIVNSIAITVAFWFNFLLNRYWSFQSSQNLKVQLIQYGMLFFFNLFISDAIMHLLNQNFGISPNIGKVLVMPVIVMWNFIIYKKVIYK